MTHRATKEDPYLLAGVVWITLKLPKYSFWTVKNAPCWAPFTCIGGKYLKNHSGPLPSSELPIWTVTI